MPTSQAVTTRAVRVSFTLRAVARALCSLLAQATKGIIIVLRTMAVDFILSNAGAPGPIRLKNLSVGGKLECG